MTDEFQSLLKELGHIFHLNLEVDKSGACSILIPPQLVIQMQRDSGQEKALLFLQNRRNPSRQVSGKYPQRRTKGQRACRPSGRHPRLFESDKPFDPLPKLPPFRSSTEKGWLHFFPISAKWPIAGKKLS